MVRWEIRIRPSEFAYAMTQVVADAPIPMRKLSELAR